MCIYIFFFQYICDIILDPLLHIIITYNLKYFPLFLNMREKTVRLERSNKNNILCRELRFFCVAANLSEKIVVNKSVFFFS